MEGSGQGEGGWGRGLRGKEGRGHFNHLAIYIMHYHMVLRPEGTSHNNENLLVSYCRIVRPDATFALVHTVRMRDV